MKLLTLLFTALFAVASVQAKIVLTERNTITLASEVNDSSIAKLSKKFADLHSKLAKYEPIYLVLNTPGGSVSAGLNFIDFINGFDRQVHTITIFAASMGYHIAQSLGKRYILPSGQLMSHRARAGGLGGQIPGELDSRVNFLLTSLKMQDAKVAKRLGISLEDYQAKIVNEWWLNSETAIATNNADEIPQVQCNEALLNGTHTEVVNALFFTVKVVLSDCPLITGPISIEDPNKQLSRQQLDYVRKYVSQSRKIISF